MIRPFLPLIMTAALVLCHQGLWAQEPAKPPPVAPSPVVPPGALPRLPPTPPDKAAATFDVRPGFHLELMAAEPLINDPVAVCFDENGRAYVVEMRDYSEHQGEKLGRIKLLTDEDGDGRYDHATIFADKLVWPTAVACSDGGVYVAAVPDLLYLKDTNGDGRADVRALVFLGFGNLIDRLNVQGLPNSLAWGPDQRLHLALGNNPSRLTNFARHTQGPLELRGQDLSFDPQTLEYRAEPGGGQWGLSFDDWGRKFVCSNSRHLQQCVMPPAARPFFPGLPASAVDIAADGPQAEVFRASPVEAWRELRTKWRVSGVTPGLIEGGGRASGYFSGACGATIYRGDAFPREFQGNAFVADCGSNLIHRKVLRGDIRLEGRRALDEQAREFAASRDNWFRPVAFANAPDGCLWVCDMYREVIEHPWSLPQPIKSQLDLDSGNDRGRLWRITPDGFRPRPPPQLGKASPAELVSLLENPNGWHRDTAARLLHERHDLSVVPELERLIRSAKTPIGRATALRVLRGLAGVQNVPWKDALEDAEPLVRAAAAGQLAAAYSPREIPAAFQDALARLAGDPSPAVRFALALSVPQFSADRRAKLLLEIAKGDISSADLRAVLSAAAGDSLLPLLQQSLAASDPSQLLFARDLVSAIGARAKSADATAAFSQIASHAARDELLALLAAGARQSGKSLRDLIDAEHRRPLESAARERLGMPGNPAAQRIAAWKVLGLVGERESARAVAPLITPRTGDDEAAAALEALDRLQGADLGRLYTELWPRLSPRVRPQLLAQWRTRPLLLSDLVAAIEAKTIAPVEVSATDLAALRTVKDASLAARVEKLFGSLGTREAAIAAMQPALQLPGVAVRGQATFRSKCSVCHRRQGEGNPVGPDLDAATASGKAKLLENILDPSREITVGYSAAAVAAKGGEVVQGVIAAETAESVTLKLQGQPPRTFARADLDRFDRSPKSLMPDGLENGLAPQDLADLLEFLVQPQSLSVSTRLPLTQFRTTAGEIQPVRTADDWRLRRGDILAQMQTVMGPLPNRKTQVPLDPRIEEEVDCGSYVRRRVTWQTEPAGRAQGYLLVPKKLLAPGGARAGAVLCLHPTDDHFGAKVVVGLGGKEHRQYAVELTERGLVTLAPAYPLLADYRPDLEELGYQSGTMKAIWDNIRGLDYLESLPFVAPRFAAIGHSLGGHNAVYTAVFDERISAVVSSCGLDSYADYRQGDITGWTSSRYMPKLALYRGRPAEIPFDFDGMLAAIAPRRVRIVAPIKDDNFRAESVDRLAASARGVFELLGQTSSLIVEHPDCGHDFPDDARRRACDWIVEFLRQP